MIFLLNAITAKVVTVRVLELKRLVNPLLWLRSEIKSIIASA